MDNEDYSIAKLNEGEIQQLKELEKEFGYMLIAYDKGQVDHKKDETSHM